MHAAARAARVCRGTTGWGAVVGVSHRRGTPPALDSTTHSAGKIKNPRFEKSRGRPGGAAGGRRRITAQGMGGGLTVCRGRAGRGLARGAIRSPQTVTRRCARVQLFEPPLPYKFHN